MYVSPGILRLRSSFCISSVLFSESFTTRTLLCGGIARICCNPLSQIVRLMQSMRPLSGTFASRFPIRSNRVRRNKSPSTRSISATCGGNSFSIMTLSPKMRRTSSSMLEATLSFPVTITIFFLCISFSFSAGTLMLPACARCRQQRLFAVF